MTMRTAAQKLLAAKDGAKQKNEAVNKTQKETFQCQQHKNGGKDQDGKDEDMRKMDNN
jgi:hypothetical protein